MAFEKSLSLDNPILRDLVFYSVIVLLKMMMLALLTSLTRLRKGVSITG